MPHTIRQELEQLPAEDIVAFGKACQSNPAIHEPTADEAKLRDQFKYFHVLLAQGMVQPAGKFFPHLSASVRHYVTAEGENWMGYLGEWGRLALTTVDNNPHEFSALEIYHELEEAFAPRPEETREELAKARLMAGQHYMSWKRSGGNPDALPGDDRAWLEMNLSTCVDNAQEAVDALRMDGKFEAAARLLQALFLTCQPMGKPNDAIAAKKELIEIFEDMRIGTPLELGDHLLQLGQLFSTYKKDQVAARYYRRAMEAYQKMGPGGEVLVMQAEALAEEAENA